MLQDGLEFAVDFEPGDDEEYDTHRLHRRSKDDTAGESVKLLGPRAMTQQSPRYGGAE